MPKPIPGGVMASQQEIFNWVYDPLTNWLRTNADATETIAAINALLAEVQALHADVAKDATLASAAASILAKLEAIRALVATDQKAQIVDAAGNPCSSSGRVNTRGQSEGPNNATAPETSTLLGVRDEGGVLRAVSARVTPEQRHALETYSRPVRAYEAAQGSLYSADIRVNCASGNNQNNIILFRNPVGSGKVFSFHRFRFTSTRMDRYINFELFVGPTVTSAGSAFSGVISRKRTSPQVTSPSALVYTLPTIGVGGRGVSEGFYTGPEPVTAHPQEIVLDGDLILYPGTDLLTVGIPEANNIIAAVFAAWSEGNVA